MFEYVGEGCLDFDTLGREIGDLLIDRVNKLYGEYTYSVLLVGGFRSENSTRSVGFAVKNYLYGKGVKIKFEALSSGIDYGLKVRGAKLEEKNSPFIYTHPVLKHAERRKVASTATRTTRESVPKNLDIFPSTWHEVASDSVTEFYSSMGVSL
jgi:hypothetical protein